MSHSREIQMKLDQLKTYVPFVERMISKLESRSSLDRKEHSDKLDKLKGLYKFLTNPDSRVQNAEMLDRMEKIVKGLYKTVGKISGNTSQYKPDSLSSSSNDQSTRDHKWERPHDRDVNASHSPRYPGNEQISDWRRRDERRSESSDGGFSEKKQYHSSKSEYRPSSHDREERRRYGDRDERMGIKSEEDRQEKRYIPHSSFDKDYRKPPDPPSFKNESRLQSNTLSRSRERELFGDSSTFTNRPPEGKPTKQSLLDLPMPPRSHRPTISSDSRHANMPFGVRQIDEASIKKHEIPNFNRDYNAERSVSDSSAKDNPRFSQINDFSTKNSPNSSNFMRSPKHSNIPSQQFSSLTASIKPKDKPMPSYPLLPTDPPQDENSALDTEASFSPTEDTSSEVSKNITDSSKQPVNMDAIKKALNFINACDKTPKGPQGSLRYEDFVGPATSSKSDYYNPEDIWEKSSAESPNRDIDLRQHTFTNKIKSQNSQPPSSQQPQPAKPVAPLPPSYQRRSSFDKSSIHSPTVKETKDSDMRSLATSKQPQNNKFGSTSKVGSEMYPLQPEKPSVYQKSDRESTGDSLKNRVSQEPGTLIKLGHKGVAATQLEMYKQRRERERERLLTKSTSNSSPKTSIPSKSSSSSLLDDLLPQPESTEKQSNTSESFFKRDRPVANQLREKPFDRPLPNQSRDKPFDRPSPNQSRDKPFDRPSPNQSRDKPFDRPSANQLRDKSFDRPSANQLRDTSVDRPSPNQLRDKSVDKHTAGQSRDIPFDKHTAGQSRDKPIDRHSSGQSRDKPLEKKSTEDLKRGATTGHVPSLKSLGTSSKSELIADRGNFASNSTPKTTGADAEANDKSEKKSIKESKIADIPLPSSVKENNTNIRPSSTDNTRHQDSLNKGSRIIPKPNNPSINLPRAIRPLLPLGLPKPEIRPRVARDFQPEPRDHFNDRGRQFPVNARDPRNVPPPPDMSMNPRFRPHQMNVRDPRNIQSRLPLQSSFHPFQNQLDMGVRWNSGMPPFRPSMQNKSHAPIVPVIPQPQVQIPPPGSSKNSVIANTFTCLMMQCLPPYANSSHIYRYFEEYLLRDICIELDQSYNCKGTAYIHFPNHINANNALEKENGKFMDGYKIFLRICSVGILRQAKATNALQNFDREKHLNIPPRPRGNGNPFYNPKPVAPPPPPVLPPPPPPAPQFHKDEISTSELSNQMEEKEEKSRLTPTPSEQAESKESNVKSKQGYSKLCGSNVESSKPHVLQSFKIPKLKKKTPATKADIESNAGTDVDSNVGTDIDSNPTDIESDITEDKKEISLKSECSSTLYEATEIPVDALPQQGKKNRFFIIDSSSDSDSDIFNKKDKNEADKLDLNVVFDKLLSTSSPVEPRKKKRGPKFKNKSQKKTESVNKPEKEISPNRRRKKRMEDLDLENQKITRQKQVKILNIVKKRILKVITPIPLKIVYSKVTEDKIHKRNYYRKNEISSSPLPPEHMSTFASSETLSTCTTLSTSHDLDDCLSITDKDMPLPLKSPETSYVEEKTLNEKGISGKLKNRRLRTKWHHGYRKGLLYKPATTKRCQQLSDVNQPLISDSICTLNQEAVSDKQIDKQDSAPVSEPAVFDEHLEVDNEDSDIAQIVPSITDKETNIFNVLSDLTSLQSEISTPENPLIPMEGSKEEQIRKISNDLLETSKLFTDEKEQKPVNKPSDPEKFSKSVEPRKSDEILKSLITGSDDDDESISFHVNQLVASLDHECSTSNEQTKSDTHPAHEENKIPAKEIPSQTSVIGKSQENQSLVEASLADADSMEEKQQSIDKSNSQPGAEISTERSSDNSNSTSVVNISTDKLDTTVAGESQTIIPNEKSAKVSLESSETVEKQTIEKKEETRNVRFESSETLVSQASERKEETSSTSLESTKANDKLVEHELKQKENMSLNTGAVTHADSNDALLSSDKKYTDSDKQEALTTLTHGKESLNSKMEDTTILNKNIISADVVKELSEPDLTGIENTKLDEISRSVLTTFSFTQTVEPCNQNKSITQPEVSPEKATSTCISEPILASQEHEVDLSGIPTTSNDKGSDLSFNKEAEETLLTPGLNVDSINKNQVLQILETLEQKEKKEGELHSTGGDLFSELQSTEKGELQSTAGDLLSVKKISDEIKDKEKESEIPSGTQCVVEDKENRLVDMDNSTESSILNDVQETGAISDDNDDFGSEIIGDALDTPENQPETATDLEHKVMADLETSRVEKDLETSQKESDTSRMESDLQTSETNVEKVLLKETNSGKFKKSLEKDNKIEEPSSNPNKRRCSLRLKSSDPSIKSPLSSDMIPLTVNIVPLASIPASCTSDSNTETDLNKKSTNETTGIKETGDSDTSNTTISPSTKPNSNAESGKKLRKEKQSTSAFSSLIERKRITRGAMVVPEINELILWNDGGAVGLFQCDLCDYVGKLSVSHITNFHSEQRDVPCVFRKEDYSSMTREPVGPTHPKSDITVDFSWIPNKMNFDTEIECRFDRHCDYYSNNRLDLAYHLLDHKPEAISNVYHCRLCNFVSNDLYQFYDHVSSHTGEYRHTCNRCGHRCFSLESLEEHHKDYHKEQSQEFKSDDLLLIDDFPYIHICKYCQFVQISFERVEAHIKSKHHGRSDSVKANMSRFIITHSDRKKEETSVESEIEKAPVLRSQAKEAKKLKPGKKKLLKRFGQRKRKYVFKNKLTPKLLRDAKKLRENISKRQNSPVKVDKTTPKTPEEQTPVSVLNDELKVSEPLSFPSIQNTEIPKTPQNIFFDAECDDNEKVGLKHTTDFINRVLTAQNFKVNVNLKKKLSTLDDILKKVDVKDTVAREETTEEVTTQEESPSKTTEKRRNARKMRNVQKETSDANVSETSPGESLESRLQKCSKRVVENQTSIPLTGIISRLKTNLSQEKVIQRMSPSSKPSPRRLSKADQSDSDSDNLVICEDGDSADIDIDDSAKEPSALSVISPLGTPSKNETQFLRVKPKTDLFSSPPAGYPTFKCRLRDCSFRGYNISEINSHSYSMHYMYTCVFVECGFVSVSDKLYNSHFEEQHKIWRVNCPLDCSSQTELFHPSDYVKHLSKWHPVSHPMKVHPPSPEMQFKTDDGDNFPRIGGLLDPEAASQIFNNEDNAFEKPEVKPNKMLLDISPPLANLPPTGEPNPVTPPVIVPPAPEVSVVAAATTNVVQNAGEGSDPKAKPSFPGSDILPLKAPTVPVSQLFLKYQSLSVFNLFTTSRAPDVFKCMVHGCKFSSDNRATFHTHLDDHVGTTEFRCCYCLVRVGSAKSLIEHVVIEHSHCQFQCKYCLYRVHSTVFLSVHLRKFHPDKEPRYIKVQTLKSGLPPNPPIENFVHPYKCTFGQCTFRSVDTEAFSLHAQTHGTSSFMSCIFCEMSVSVFTITEHMKIHMMNEFQCPYCLFGESEREKLLTHLVNCHPGRPGKVLLRRQVSSATNSPAFPPKSTVASTPSSSTHTTAVTTTTVNALSSPPKPVSSPATISGDKTTTSPAVSAGSSQPKPVEGSAQIDASPSVDPKQDQVQVQAQSKPTDPLAPPLEETGLTGNDLYRCGNVRCQYSCDSQLVLKEHLQVCDFSRDSPLLKCYHCSKQFRHLSGLLDHIKVHGPKRYFCGVEGCLYRSTMLHYFRNHMKQIHHQSAYKVVLKDFSNKDPETQEFLVVAKDVGQSNLKEHHKKRRNEFDMDDINKIPRAHVSYHDLKCYHCTYFSKVRLNLVKHLKLHKKYPNGIPNSKESEEVKIIPSSPPINPVPRLDRKELMFDKMMNLAGSSFTKQAKEENELRSKHPIPADEMEKMPVFVPEEMLYSCGIDGCKYLSCDETMLKYHIQTLHSESTFYMCPHCPIWSELTLDQMGLHFKLHGDVLFRCGWCPHLANRKALVERHLSEVHPNDKPFSFCIRGSEVAEPNSEDPKSAGSSSAGGSTQKLGWQCGLCAFKAAIQSEIVNHTNLKHGVKSQYKCGYCHVRSSARTAFDAHFATKHHDKPFRVLCMFYRLDSNDIEPLPQGGSTTSHEPLWRRNDPDRRRHIRGIPLEEHEDDQEHKLQSVKPGDPNGDEFVCPKCHSFKTPCLSTFRSHLCKEANYKRFECAECGISNELLPPLRRHYTKTHGSSFTADCYLTLPIDPVLEAWVESIISHQQHKIKIWKEEGGVSSKSRKRSLSQSQSDEVLASGVVLNPSSSEKGKFVCSECGIECRTASGLKSHLTSMHVSKFKCHLCPFSSNSALAVENHLAVKHPKHASDSKESGETPQPSQELPTQSQNKDSLSSKTGAKCPHCPYTTNTQKGVKLHINRVHAKNKRYRCGYCKAWFETLLEGNRHSARRHATKHADIKYMSLESETEGAVESSSTPEGEQSSASEAPGHVCYSCCHCSVKGPYVYMEEHLKAQHRDLPFLLRKLEKNTLHLEVYQYKCGHCPNLSASLMEAMDHWVKNHVTLTFQFSVDLISSNLIQSEPDPPPKEPPKEVSGSEGVPTPLSSPISTKRDTSVISTSSSSSSPISSKRGSEGLDPDSPFTSPFPAKRDSTVLTTGESIVSPIDLTADSDGNVSESDPKPPKQRRIQHKCFYCEKICKRKFELNNHIRKVHKGKPIMPGGQTSESVTSETPTTSAPKKDQIFYRCDICAHVVKTKMAIKGHMLKTHPSNNNEFTCIQLESNVSHPTSCPFKCNYCGDTFDSEQKVESHHTFLHSHLVLNYTNLRDEALISLHKSSLLPSKETFQSPQHSIISISSTSTSSPLSSPLYETTTFRKVKNTARKSFPSPQPPQQSKKKQVATKSTSGRLTSRLALVHTESAKLDESFDSDDTLQKSSSSSCIENPETEEALLNKDLIFASVNLLGGTPMRLSVSQLSSILNLEPNVILKDYNSLTDEEK